MQPRARVLDQDYEMVGIESVRPHPKNPRQGDVGAISESIEANGFYGAIVVQRSTGYVLAGNHRLMAARAQGLSEVPCVWVDVDDERAVKILLADNRTNDLASYNDSVLAELLADLANTSDLAGTGYDGDDLDALIAEMAGDGRSGVGDTENDAIEATDALTEKWGVQPGQVWEIGSHRLMCGESTDPEQLSKLLNGATDFLVFTDPPYGISAVKNNKSGPGGKVGFGKKVGKHIDAHNYLPIRNDESTGTAQSFYEVCAPITDHMILWGGNYFTGFLPSSRCWIVWDKQNGDNQFADAELAWTSFDKGVRLIPWLWNGLARKGDRATEGKSRFHPTQKPVGLHVLILEEFNKDKRIIVDGFCGSGTTMIAAEKAGMTCYGMECEPGYVAVTLERLSQMGLEPRLVDGTQ